MGTYGMLLLLDLDLAAILEAPAHDVGLLGGALDGLGLGERAPELAEVLELDVVPDVGERGCDKRTVVSLCVGENMWGFFVLQCCDRGSGGVRVRANGMGR